MLPVIIVPFDFTFRLFSEINDSFNDFVFLQPSVEGFNGGEQRRKRIFSGNFTEIIKCLVFSDLRRPLFTLKGLGTSGPQPLNEENLGGITMKFFNLTFTESYVLPVGLDISGFEIV